jgi:hypothetical protein
MVVGKKETKNMNINELKLYVINSSTLGVTTFTQIEDWLKIALLLVTIGYTITKWAKVKDEDDK